MNDVPIDVSGRSEKIVDAYRTSSFFFLHTLHCTTTWNSSPTKWTQNLHNSAKNPKYIRVLKVFLCTISLFSIHYSCCLVTLPLLLPSKIPRLIWEFFYTQPAVCIAFWYYHSYNFVILGLSSRCRDAFSCPHCKAEGKLPLTITRMLLFKGLTSQIVTGGQQYHSNSQKIPPRNHINEFTIYLYLSIYLLWVYIDTPPKFLDFIFYFRWN